MMMKHAGVRTHALILEEKKNAAFAAEKAAKTASAIQKKHVLKSAAGMLSEELDLAQTPLTRLFVVRLFWLAVLTAFGALTSSLVADRADMLEKVIVLAAFLAPVVDMGGNTGSQSATLVIRAMATGSIELAWRDLFGVLKRECMIALLLGLVIGVLEAFTAWEGKGVAGDVLLVVGCAMAACTALGGVVGAILPFAAKALGVDPAALSSPLITSVMDLLGVLVYFGFASWFLGPMLG